MKIIFLSSFSHVIFKSLIIFLQFGYIFIGVKHKLKFSDVSENLIAHKLLVWSVTKLIYTSMYSEVVNTYSFHTVRSVATIMYPFKSSLSIFPWFYFVFSKVSYFCNKGRRNTKIKSFRMFVFFLNKKYRCFLLLFSNSICLCIYW